jgi:hypothetical protein
MRAAAVITGYQDELNLAGCCGGRAGGVKCRFSNQERMGEKKRKNFFFGILKFVDRERMFFSFFDRGRRGRFTYL